MADEPGEVAPAGLTDEEVVNAVRKLAKPGEDAHKQRTKRYDTSYDIYRARVGQQAGGDKIPAWRARTRIPYAQYTIDTEVVGISSGVPRCVVHARRAQDVLAAQAMQNVMDYFIGEDHLVEKQPVVAQQALVYGVTGGKNTWGYEEASRTRRLYLPNDQGQLVPVTQDTPVVTRDGPCFEPWSVYDILWDPNARDVDSARYVILRSWVTRDYLEENEFDPQTGQGLYRNLDRLLETSAPRRDRQTAQDVYIGGNQNKRDGMFLLEEFWTDSTLIVVGNMQVLLRATGNPYWHGRKPVVLAQTRPDFFEVQGIPEVDMVADIQATMQTLQNMVLDSLKLTVLRGVTYREGSVVDPAMLAMRPNFKWGVTDHDDIRPFEVPQLGSDVYNMLSSLLGDMERVTGVSAYLSGADSSTVNQTTATGVTALQSAANTALKFKAKQLRDRVYQRTYEQWGDLIQQYLTDPVELEITGGDGKKAWITVGHQDVVGDFRFRLEGSEEALSRQTERAEMLQLLNAMAPFAQMPNSPVNLPELLKKVAGTFDIQPPESLVNEQPQQPQLPPPAPGPPGGGAQFPAGGPGMGQPPLGNGMLPPAVVQQAVTGR